MPGFPPASRRGAAAGRHAKALILIGMLHGAASAAVLLPERPPVDLSGRGLLCSALPAAALHEPAGKARPGERFIYLSGGGENGWNGILRKFRVTLDSHGMPVIDAIPVWDAGERLTGNGLRHPFPLPAARNIFTAYVDKGAIVRTIPFQWPLLDPHQKSVLNTAPDGHAGDGMGEARLEYLRGERALERPSAGGFRARTSVLGDALFGRPVQVGPPSSGVRGDGYRSFFEQLKGRSTAVYLNAGDGLLHAFDDSNGAELFAYAPAALFPANRLLMATGTWQGHLPASEVAVAEASVRGHWGTVLASGMGGGAQGVFALDVSDPAHFGHDEGVLFEFTDSDDPDIGHVMAAPAIAKFTVRTVGGIPQHRYFVVVASGFNNYRPDGAGRYNPGAPGALFLLSLDKSPSAKWQLNVNYYKFSVPASLPEMPNALAAPALVTGNDGAVRFAYAGDLQGNLWRFDFTGTAPWKSALGSEPAAPLFTAVDDGNLRQPITVRPRVAFAPWGGYVVLFGTGRFIEQQDALPSNYRTQSFYAIRDAARPDYRVARSELQPRVAARGTDLKPDTVGISGAAFDYSPGPSGKKGWYVDFLLSSSTGERSVTEPSLSGTQVSFATLMPAPSGCAGAERLYLLNALTGLKEGQGINGPLSAGATLNRGLLFETRAKARRLRVDEPDAVTRRMFAIDPAALSASPLMVREWAADTELVSRRIGWRELINWRELLIPAQGK